MKRVILALLVAFSTGFFIFSTPVSAYDGWTNLSTVTLRRSYLAGNHENIWNELVGNVSIPFNIMEYGWLHGFTLHSINLNGPSYKSFTNVYLDVALRGQSGWYYHWDNPPINANIRDNSNTWHNMSCEIFEGGDNWIKTRCSIALPENKKPSAIDYTWGFMNSNEVLGIATSSPLTLYYAGWGYDTAENPSVQYLQQMAQQNQTIINQNQTVINQNEQIINQQNQTNQNLTDINSTMTNSTVSGDFSVSAIPAFGPIAGILNNLLELPRILLAVPACSPIRPTLPFVHQDIEIPCMSTIYSQAYPAFIIFLDAITSAYIWFRVARYIVRQVQHLRDPEQEDEEYLDI